MARVPRNVTVCPDCTREVGVQPGWNKTVSTEIAAFPSASSWRASVHGVTPSGPRCPGSRAIIPDVLVWSNDRAARREAAS